MADGASNHCLVTRRYDEAIAEGRRAQLLDPGYLYRDSPLAGAYTAKGMYAEALAVYQKIQQARGGPLGGLAITYAKMGRTDEARRIADELKKIAETRYFAAEPIALIHAALGETDEAFKWLDRAARKHSARLQAVVFAPEFRPLHSEPRFRNLLQRIGVDPAKVLARNNAP